jgi:hypothetical protein
MESVYDPNSKSMQYEGEPYEVMDPSAGFRPPVDPTTGLRPNEAATIQNSILDDYKADSKPYTFARDRLAELDALLAATEGRETLNRAETEQAATAFIKAQRPDEAVMSEEYGRTVNTGWRSIFNALMPGEPIQASASRKRLKEWRDATAALVAQRKEQQKRIRANYEQRIAGKGITLPDLDAGAPRGGARVLSAEEARSLGLPD